MTDQRTFTKGDYGFKIPFTVKKGDDTVLDLTGYTVTAKIWKPGSTTPKVSRAAAITDAVNGKCELTISSGDFDAVEDYQLALVLTKTGLQETTASRVPVKIQESPP